MAVGWVWGVCRKWTVVLVGGEMRRRWTSRELNDVPFCTSETTCNGGCSRGGSGGGGGVPLRCGAWLPPQAGSQSGVWEREAGGRQGAPCFQFGSGRPSRHGRPGWSARPSTATAIDPPGRVPQTLCGCQHVHTYLGLSGRLRQACRPSCRRVPLWLMCSQCEGRVR